MDLHECENCKDINSCVLKEELAWIAEHEDACKKAAKDVAPKLAVIYDRLAKVFPPIALVGNEFLRYLVDAFIIGYVKGRTFGDVPEVFKKEVDG